MTLLWISIVLLTTLVVGIIAYSLIRARPEKQDDRAEFDLNVYRDQLKELEHEHERGLLSDDDAEGAITEIKRRMLTAADQQKKSGSPKHGHGSGQSLSSILTVIVVGVGISGGAIALYLYLGKPGLSDQPYASRTFAPQPDASEAENAMAANANIENMLANLAKRLVENPDDLKGWSMLGRSYLALDRNEEALNALNKARELSNNDPVHAAAYAEALLVTSTGPAPEQAFEIFDAIRKEDPFNPKARYYQGIRLAQAGNVRAAMQEWVDLVAVSYSDAPYLEVVHQQIERAAVELGVAVDAVRPSTEALELAKALPAAAAPAVQTQTPSPAQTQIPSPSQEQIEAVTELSEEDRKEMIAGMVASLAERLKENPADKRGWEMLGRSYTVLGEHEKAKQAFDKAKALP